MTITTATDLRTAWSVISDEDRFSDALLDDLVAEFTAIVERARGVLIERVDRTDKHRAPLYGRTTLRWPVDVVVSEVKVNDVALSAGVLAGLDPVGDDNVLSGGPWCPGDRLEVTYESGLADLPAGSVRICGEFVRAKALATVNATPRNTISYSDDSGYVFRESTADWSAGRYTGLIVVDDWVNSLTDYRLPGFA